VNFNIPGIVKLRTLSGCYAFENRKKAFQNSLYSAARKTFFQALTKWTNRSKSLKEGRTEPTVQKVHALTGERLPEALVYLRGPSQVKNS
jgi:hypothetical protein